MQMPLRCVVLAALIGAVPSAASAGDLRFTLVNGRATIVASEVSLRQILDEWARVGHTTVVNADKLIGTPVTLQLVDVPEDRRSRPCCARRADTSSRSARAMRLVSPGSTVS